MNAPLSRIDRPGPASGLKAALTEVEAVHPGSALSVVFFDRPTGARGRLSAGHGGRDLPKPFLSAALDLRGGGHRHVLLLPFGRGDLLRARLLLRLDGRLAAELDPGWLQAPESDLAALIEGLAEGGLHRLLRLMLTTGASLFAGPAGESLATAARHLMDLCAIPLVRPVARSDIAGRSLLSFPLPGATGLAALSSPMALGAGRPLRLPALTWKAEAAAGGDLLHVLLPLGAPEAEVVVFADRPLRLSAPVGLPRLPAPLWLKGQGPGLRDWLLEQVATLGAADLLRELAVDAIAPSMQLLHLSVAPAGLLHAVALTDPSRLVRALIFDGCGARTEVILPQARGSTVILAGLADMAGLRAGAEVRLRIDYHSGRLRTVARQPLTAYDGGHAEGFEAAWRWRGRGSNTADPIAALARAQASLAGPAPAHFVLQFGPVRPAALRIVTPVGPSGDILRARAALIFAERRAPAVEVICTMTDGPLAEPARQAMAETAEIYGIPHRLVLLPAGASAGAALHAGLSQAEGTSALLLGADVLPSTPGWLAAWIRALRRRDMLGGVVLAADGAIGSTRAGEDPLAGLPPSALPRRIDGLRRPMSACIGLAPSALARLLVQPAHPDPNLWLARLTHLAGSGLSVDTRLPFQRMAPGPRIPDLDRAVAEAGFALIAEGRE